MSLPKVSSEVSRCEMCNAVMNPRWGKCLACGSKERPAANLLQIDSAGIVEPFLRASHPKTKVWTPRHVASEVSVIHERWNERAAIAEVEGGLSRIEAELLAWNDVKTCVACFQETDGEADAVRVSGGGWLHLDKCYGAHLGFRQ